MGCTGSSIELSGFTPIQAQVTHQVVPLVTITPVIRGPPTDPSYTLYPQAYRCQENHAFLQSQVIHQDASPLLLLLPPCWSRW